MHPFDIMHAGLCYVGGGGVVHSADREEERHSPGNERQKSFRKRLYAFLEARTPGGRRFESFIMVIIFITVTEVGRSEKSSHVGQLDHLDHL